MPFPSSIFKLDIIGKPCWQRSQSLSITEEGREEGKMGIKVREKRFITADQDTNLSRQCRVAVVAEASLGKMSEWEERK